MLNDSEVVDGSLEISHGENQELSPSPTGVTFASKTRVIVTPLQESIVERTRQIDNLLFKLGGRGRNMQERVQSVRSVLDEHDLRHLARILTINRGMVYEANFRLEGDHQGFLAACDRLIVRLEGQLATATTVQPSNVEPTSRQTNKSLSTAVVVAAFLIAAVLCTIPSVHPGWTHRFVMAMPLLVALLVGRNCTARFAAKHR